MKLAHTARTKRALLLLLAGLLLFPLVAGAEAQLPAKTINIFILDDGQSEWANPDFRYLKNLAAGGNLTFHITAVPRGNYGDKVTTTIASGNLPDLMFFNGSSQFEIMMEYGPKGLFMPLTQYLEDMPNFQKVIEKYPYYKKMYQASDGEYYAFPFVYDTDLHFSKGICIRDDILEQGGMKLEDIQTIDDLYEALKLIKSIKGNAPYSSRSESEWINDWAPIFGTDLYMYYNQTSGGYHFGPYDENFRAMVTYLNKLYAEGLIVPDIASVTDQIWEQSLINDESYFMIDNMMLPPQVVADGTRVMSPLLPPMVDGQRYYATKQLPCTSQSRFWTISPKSQAVENILAMVEYAYSPEGSELLFFGIEGEDFVRDAEGDRLILCEPDPSIPGDTAGAAYNRIIYSQGFQRTYNAFLQPKDSFEAKVILGDYFSNARKLYMENGVLMEAIPSLPFTQEELEIKKSLETPISTYTDENTAKFVMGLRPMEEFDQFLKELENMKVSELIALYEGAFARYQAQ